MAMKWRTIVKNVVAKIASSLSFCRGCEKLSHGILMPKRYVLSNANVITMDNEDSRANAIAVEDGRIVSVGTQQDMSELLQRGWKCYDVAGKTILPGFSDCHSHLDLTGITYAGISGCGFVTIEEAVEAIAARARQTPTGKPIIMFGVKDTQFTDDRVPNRWDLDEATTVHPVIIVEYTWHQSYLNSCAIDYFQVTEMDDGADIENGLLNGVLRDPISITVNSKAVSNISQLELIAGIKKAACGALQHGVTTIHTMQGGMDICDIDEVMEMLEPQLPVHIITWDQSNDVAKVLQRKLPRMGGCGAMQADGEIGSNTAALFEPYTNQLNSKGLLNHTQEYWDKLILTAHCNQLQFAAHAEGEAGIEAVLCAMEKAQAQCARKDARHRIEHLELPTMTQLERMEQAGIIASVQPAFVDLSDKEFKQLCRSYGKTRMKRFNPYRSIYEKGVVMVGGSDSPVSPYDALLGVYWALNHPVVEERLPLREALKMVTINAAYSGFEEDDKGSLEKGKLAELVILSNDPYQVQAEKLHELVVVEYVIAKGSGYQTAELAKQAEMK
ncbi:amidohydrolase [Azotosporobacter soli]|uniref:amidohydrolase n=1 Tax=Azotosporobacter soli TaxID=3055040 RepID=UPI0031FEBE13